MAGVSPARRLRTKTSDITDFFRVGHSATQLRPVQNDLSTSSSMTLEVPSADEGSGLTKKRTTRIPFLGRTRKKSNQSAASSPYASTGARDSMDVGELPSSREPSIDR